MDAMMYVCFSVFFVMVMCCFHTKAHPSVGTTQEDCPEYCQCDLGAEHVICANMEEFSWLSFLSTVPLDTKHLTVENSVFQVETIQPNFTLPQVHTLKIVNTNFSDLTFPAFAPLGNLVELHLDHNNISNVDTNLFLVLEDLEVFSLKGNKISSLSNETFQHAKSIRVLNLAENELRHFHAHVFQPLTMLEVLNMSSNEIEFIHPVSFVNLTKLRTVHLNSNNMQVLHEEVFDNVPNLKEVHMHDNPLDCNCGLHWFTDVLAAEKGEIYKNKEQILCHSPQHLEFVAVVNASKGVMNCTEPQIQHSPSSMRIMRIHDRVLHCNATGYPPPSIYWITPRGVVADPSHRKWITPDIVNFHKSKSFIAKPTYRKSWIEAFENGSLLIHDIRHYFSGEYTCVAENPAGIVTMSFNVTVWAPVSMYVHRSMAMGAVCAVGFFFFGVIFALLKMCVIRVCRTREPEKLADLESGIEEQLSESSEYYESSPSIYKRYTPDYYSTTPELTPWESPRKCATPAEAYDAERKFDEMGNDILLRLTDARERLRHGVERQVGRIRTRAAHVRDSSSKYMQTIRESSTNYIQTIRASSSNYIHTIRSSGSQYASRVRTGVALGVEQVKYHVQSMKEFCGTSNMSHTISTVSFSTNVDSQKRTEIVKTVTHTYV